MNRELIDRQIEAARSGLKEVEEKLSKPEIVSDPSMMKELGREHRRLKSIISISDNLLRLEQELESSRELLNEEDEELAELAQSEVESLEVQVDDALVKLRLALLPANPEDERDAIIEVRAGTGGEEAGLFAGDLYRMYQRLAERRGWKVESLSEHPSEMGGFKEISFVVRGDGTYGELKFEGGVHRVQRVPETESSGRIHTSAASVAVLPEAEEVDFELDPKDLRIDVYRSSGPGGQSVNTTDSAVRVTHLPTNTVVTCQDEKSQHKNKAKALLVLRSRLYERALAEEQEKRAESRRLHVGTGDRSAKIRTYNFPQSRVTDHRINLTLYNLDAVLQGDLDAFIEALRLENAEQRLKMQLS